MLLIAGVYTLFPLCTSLDASTAGEPKHITDAGFFNFLGLGLTALLATLLFRVPYVNSWKHSSQVRGIA